MPDECATLAWFGRPRSLVERRPCRTPYIDADLHIGADLSDVGKRHLGLVDRKLDDPPNADYQAINQRLIQQWDCVVYALRPPSGP